LATTTEHTGDQHDAAGVEDDERLDEDEVLIEEISIDGMCGVY
jgi:mycofactocin precursor